MASKLLSFDNFSRLVLFAYLLNLANLWRECFNRKEMAPQHKSGKLDVALARLLSRPYFLREVSQSDP